MSNADTLEWPPAAAYKRLLAMLYDALIVFAVVAVGTVVLMPFTGGEAIPRGHLGYQAWLLFLVMAYFIISWTRAGQTVGMRAWHLHLIDANGRPPRWPVAILRFFAGLGALLCAGVGIAWMLIDPMARGWHDIATGTQVVQGQ